MHFVIVGNGVAGTTAALTIAQREPKAAITLISAESDYFFSRTALMYAYMDRMSLRDLEPFERTVYDKQAIRRVRGRVIDLDAGSRTLKFESGQAVTYDRLLLATGSLPNNIVCAGLSDVRQGVANFVSLQDLENCELLTRSTREAVVVGGGLIGVELVECLAFHGKRVTFLVREPWYWPAALGPEEGAMISDHIRRHGVDVHLEEEMAQVMTDVGGRVRGVRTSAGNEFPCQMFGITVGVHPAIEWLERVTTRPVLRRGIVVTPSFATSLESVWAAGDCAELEDSGAQPFVEQIWYSAKRQGELAARSMLGDDIHYRPPIFYNSAKFFEIEYTTVGLVSDIPQGARSFYSRPPGRDVSVRIIEDRGAVAGFNMLGSRWNHTFFERWIAEHRSLDYVMDYLGAAQFDVEFGRQDLSHIVADYRRTIN